MSWNRPTDADNAKRPARSAKAPSAVRGIVAGLVIAAALGAVLYFLFDTQPETPVERETVKERGKLKEVAPAAVPKSVAKEVVAEKVEKPKEKEITLPTYRDERGILRYEGGARVPGQRPTAKPLNIHAHKPQIFKHPAEEHISWMLEMQLGEPVIGDMQYGEAFVKSFKESLNEPIEFFETDDDYTRDLKQAVIDTKKELQERMKKGEDVAKIMNDAMDEYRRLGRFKHDLQVQLLEIRNDTETYSDQDVQDFTAAANEMLKKEGLPPLAMPRAMMRSLRKGR